MKDEITPEELKKEKKKFTIIDVREANEFADGHMENAKNIPTSTFEYAEKEGQIPKDKPVMVYCLHGIRSARVLKFLKAKGYKNVCHLAGGFDAWSHNA